MAYQMLVSEGYLVTKGRQVPEFPQLARLPNVGNPSQRRKTAATQPYQARLTGTILPFQPGVPALDAFPGKYGLAWRDKRCA
jgi:GntR family transcriptional regulator/MocR family aminotransferase